MQELLHEGSYLRFVKQNGREWVERLKGTGAVQVVAVLPGSGADGPDDRKILIIEQRRPAVDRPILELPAGICADHAAEIGETAALRELEEETGYKAEKMHFMSQGPSCSGLCSEVTSFFLGTGLTKVGDGGGVEDEKITVHEAPLLRIGPWLAERGLMVDPRVWAGLYLRIAFLTQRPDVDRL